MKMSLFGGALAACAIALSAARRSAIATAAA
jgi:hypothetical protein